jgi:F0F1-type ATP synthase delta subunit
MMSKMLNIAADQAKLKYFSDQIGYILALHQSRKKLKRLLKDRINQLSF